MNGVVAEILLFHHAHGQTAGFLAFADELRAARHVVHAPDLYDGKTFTDLDEGVGYAKEVGFGTITERGRLAADGLPNGLVYAGFSLGALPAQMLAQTRPGAKGETVTAARPRWAAFVGAVAAGAAAGVQPDTARQPIENLPDDRLLQVDELVARLVVVLGPAGVSLGCRDWLDRHPVAQLCD